MLGNEAEHTLRAALELPDARILVLPNAVPDPHPSPRGGLASVAAGPVHLVFLGYLSARKGVPELLQALASPALAALPWRATLAGGVLSMNSVLAPRLSGSPIGWPSRAGSISLRPAPYARSRISWSCLLTLKG